MFGVVSLPSNSDLNYWLQWFLLGIHTWQQYYRSPYSLQAPSPWLVRINLTLSLWRPVLPLTNQKSTEKISPTLCVFELSRFLLYWCWILASWHIRQEWKSCLLSFRIPSTQLWIASMHVLPRWTNLWCQNLYSAALFKLLINISFHLKWFIQTWLFSFALQIVSVYDWSKYQKLFYRYM